LTIRGRGNLPVGSCVLVANHQSHLDALTILSALPLRRLHAAFPAAADDYFFKTLPRLAVAAVVANALPFSRESAGARSLRLCRTLLEKPGNILILFPEGTRSPTGALGEFLPGIGMILAGNPVPVVPCHIGGAHAAWPKGRKLPRPGRLALTIGAPLEFGQRARTRASAEQITQELRRAVASLASGG
jgi:1-acyl-sn-glycerol-3-phosphate acyltransferase